MRLLVDTHVLIALLDAQLDALDQDMQQALAAPEAILHASVASLYGHQGTAAQACPRH
jgi:PIN domain nuclease of toxin-antitoxin system